MEIKFTYELNRVTSRKATKPGSKKKSVSAKALRYGNEMISSNDRLDPHTKADLTAHLRNLSRETAFKEYEHPERIMFSNVNPCHIGIVVCPPSDRRMDAPNWYPTVKALIDGLTDAGIFEDDNNKVIRSMIFIPGPVTSNKKYRIEIVIREGVDPSWQT